MRAPTMVTQNPATGLRHNTIRHPNGRPPTPYGCRWCGTPQHHHGRSYITGAGMHTWERPTNTQILARMRARRTTRLNAEPPQYHATTAWDPAPDGESADPYCADCKTPACHRWSRIYDRLNQQRCGLPRRTKHPLNAAPAGGGWGGYNPSLPF